MAFTDSFIKSLKPTGSPYRKFEKGHVKGFGLQVSAKGKVTFFLCFTDEDKTRYKTLGTYPDLSLVEAWKKAEQFRDKVDSGMYDTRKQGTIQHLFDYYLTQKTKEGKRTVPEMRRSLYSDALPLLKPDILAHEVTPQDIRKILHQCIARGAPIQANRLRSYLKSAFQYGIRHDHDPVSMNTLMLFNLKSNPVDAVPPGTQYESVGERVLTLEELKKVWNMEKISTLSVKHVYILRLIILFTGLRSSEVSQARKNEFDLADRVWSIPPERTKNKKWHVLPLTPTTHLMVRQLMAWFPDSDYLLPGVTDAKPEHKTSLKHAVVKAVEKTGMEWWTPRDLRRTCKTWAGKAGLSKEIRDRLLNHAATDVSSKHYDRYMYLREKEEALLLWESFLKKEVMA